MVQVEVLCVVLSLLWWMFCTPIHCITDSDVGICIRHIPNPKDYKKIPYIDVREHVAYLDMVEKSTVFIDRSLLIQRILEIGNKVILITFPSRSGKSVNLSMLKAFFEIRINATTKKVIPSTQCAAYKFFTEGKIIMGSDTPLQPRIFVFGDKIPNNDALRPTTILKNPPLIAAYKNIIDEHLANHPVIHADLLFQSFWYVPTIAQNLKEEIVRVYNNHIFLKEIMEDIIRSNETSNIKKKRAQKNLNLFAIYAKDMTVATQIDDTDLENSLQILSKIMYEYFERYVIILMDGYCSSLEYFLLYEEESYAHEQGKKNALPIQNGIKLLRNFFRKSFVDNPYLEKAILTGSLSVNKKDLLADVPDVVHFNAIENNLQEFYGVTEKQLEILFEHFNIPSELRKEARDFYNGYAMEPNTNLNIYNTWSVINFLNFKAIGKYWIQHTNIFEKTLHWLDLENTFHILHPLLYGNGTRIHFEEADFDKKELLFLPQMVSRKTALNDVTQDAINVILSLFCELGLLTYAERVKNSDETFWFRVPNREIRESVIESVRNNLNGTTTTIRPKG